MIEELPSFELLEDMYSMPSTPLICCSSGIVTLFSTTSALAPGYDAETRTVGGVMCGNWPTGSNGNDTAPASVIRIARTDAKMGRAMKKSTKAGRRLPEGGEDLILRNPVLDLRMELRQQRPVDPGPMVMRGVEAEIPRQPVVDPVVAVHAGAEMVRRLAAGVVLVGRPDRVGQREEGRHDEDQETVQRVQPERGAQQRVEGDLHQQERTQ